MTKLIFSFTLFFALLSCSKKEEGKNELQPYIISKTDRELEEYLKKTGKVILIDIGFYCRDQIIIDQNQNIYYHPIYSDFPISDFICGTNWEEETIPCFINLSQNDLVKIPKNGLNAFLNEKASKKSKNKTLLIIGSQCDTIKNTEFLKFLKKIKSRYKYYKIRRTTQEEDTVLYYKKLNRLYLPDSIKWDKTKISFQRFLLHRNDKKNN